MHRLLAACLLLLASPGFALDPPANFQQPDPRQFPDLFVWRDTCNVYVLRSGDSALLIDLGDGSVLPALAELGIRRVEWVLFTHHHREQCQGAPQLDRAQTKVAVPAAERALFENPASFRKMRVRLGDAFTIHGSSYVRPSVNPVPIDREFKKMDTFEWKGFNFWCVDARGNSPGSMAYLLRSGDRWLAFSGDLMLEGARMHTWFDTEWDYGFASGIWALCNSAAQVAGYDPAWLFPSHGAPIHQPARQLAEYQRKLVQLEKLLVRGYPVSTFAGAAQDKTSRPSRVPHFWQVSPHIFKFRGPDSFPNFYLVLAPSGRALVVDCGLLDTATLDEALAGMKREYGLKGIDAAVITHMHGDHFLQAPHLREKYGAKIWALDRMAPVCEHPEWFDYAAPIQAYGSGLDRLSFDRLFRSGESFDWEGYTFTVDWMPGQTEFALCLHGTIDGRKVAFTGDNLFGDPDDPSQTGHEAVVAHNSAVLEEGYILGAEYLKRLAPDLILGGHSYVMDRPAAFIERFRQWSYQMRAAFQDLSSEPDYRPWFDPFWVRAEPYRARVKPGDHVTVNLHLRNFDAQAATYLVSPAGPPGLTFQPATLRVEVPAASRATAELRIAAAENTAASVRIVGLDITRNNARLGQLFDCIVEVAAP